MNSPVLRISPFLFALLLALATASPARSEEWYEAYHRAENALAQEDWKTALTELHRAIDLEPTSDARARTYGMRFVEYFPFLKLGVAYYQLDQFDEALRAFETERAQGQVSRSPKHLAELNDLSREISEKQAALVATRRTQRTRVVDRGLEEARRLQGESRPQDALAALDRVLAVDPENTIGLDLRQLLRTEVADLRDRERRQERAQDLERLGRDALGNGRFTEAASALSEALELGGDPSLRGLLESAQQGIRDALNREATDGAAEPTVDVETLLANARTLMAAEALDPAMAKVQEVMALEPDNQSARALATEISGRRARAVAESNDAEAVELWITQATTLNNDGRHEEALRVANQVLAINASESRALRLVNQSYARLNAALLDDATSSPILVIDDAPGEGESLSVAESSLNLTGTVFDSGPVDVQAFFNGEQVPVQLAGRALPDVWVSSFELHAQVPPGTSSVEIRATDTSGQTAISTHTIDYSVPFFRSGWLPALIVLSLLAILTCVVFVRRRRRNSLLRRRFNPYVAGAPVLDQRRFFGRQDLLEYVLRRIPNNSIMLYGERRIGKTSFQHQLKRCLEEINDPDHAFFPVFVDLQGTPQETFFATVAGEIFQELSPLLGDLSPQRETLDDQYTHRDLVKDLHAIFKVLTTQTNKKVKLVLLIDEVDELNDYDPRVNQRLRSLFMRAFAENLVAVVSGVAIKKQWEREGSPWYNFFQEIEVEPLDDGAARSLIEAPVRGVFAFDHGVADEIIRRAERKPYVIQRLCSWIIDRMHDQRRSDVKLSDVEAACQAEGL